MKQFFFICSMILIATTVFANHQPEDYTRGEPLTYRELNAYLQQKGWDKVHYAENTGLALMFVTGETKNGKRAIYFYGKSFRANKDTAGDILTDEYSLVLPPESGQEAIAHNVNDGNATNLIFDLSEINPAATKNSEKLLGFRALVYDGFTSTVAVVGQVEKGRKDKPVLMPSGDTTAIIWLLDKTGKTKLAIGAKIDDDGEKLHVLDQTYPIANFSYDIHASIMPYNDPTPPPPPPAPVAPPPTATLTLEQACHQKYRMACFLAWIKVGNVIVDTNVCMNKGTYNIYYGYPYYCN